MLICEHCAGEFAPPKYGKTVQRFCSLTCSNLRRGIEGEKKRRSKYALDPRSCAKCESNLSYEQNKTRNKYCSHSCAATISGTGVVRSKRDRAECKQCGRIYLPHLSSLGVYCSSACARTARQAQSRQDIENGLVASRESLKKYLTETVGYHCNRCGISEWLEEPIALQLDHIDGNAANNMPSNLRLMCPNCHCQTETWGSRNVGNGRKSRGISKG